MDEAYQDVQNNVSPAEQSSSTSLWPEGNRTVGGLAAVSPTYTEKLVIHPKTLEIVDAMLMPVEPMSGRIPATEAKPEVVELRDGGTLVVFKAPLETDPNCHHYNIGAAVMLEVRGGLTQSIKFCTGKTPSTNRLSGISPTLESFLCPQCGRAATLPETTAPLA